MRSYLLLWFTQKIPGLGSAMTAYALVIWSYTQEGSALQTATISYPTTLYSGLNFMDYLEKNNKNDTYSARLKNVKNILDKI